MPPITPISHSTINITEQTLTWDRQGTAPTIQYLSLDINESEGIDYVEFAITYQNTSVEWLDTPGTTPPFAYFDGINAYLYLEFKNLQFLPAGTYRSQIIFSIKNSSGFNRQLTSIINITLIGEPSAAVVTDKNNYFLVYNRENNTISGENFVTILNNTDNDDVEFESINSTLLKEVVSTDYFYLEEDPNYPFATNSELPQNGQKIVFCRLKIDGQYIYTFTVTIVVVETSELTVTPEQLQFELRWGFNETHTLFLNISNPLNESFTILTPSWLTASVTSGSSTMTVNFTTVNSDTILPGNYTGVIIISYLSTEKIIPVTLLVKQFAFLENTENIIFCLDKPILHINKWNTDGFYARYTLNMQFNVGGHLHSFIESYTIPYHNNHAQSDIGEKIQKFFPIWKECLLNESGTTFNNIFVYQYCKVNIVVQELDYKYNILNEYSISDLNFIAGSRPKLYPILSNVAYRRRFSELDHIISYVTEDLSSGDLARASFNPDEANSIQTLRVCTGSIIKISVLNSIGLNFVIRPNPEHYIPAQWLNENLVPEFFNFTGSYKITREFEHQLDGFMVDGQKYSSKEITKLTVNTGYIIEEEIAILREIIKSKLTWLKIDGVIYKCLPNQTKLTERDSDIENLYQFDLEFLIVL